MNDQDFYSLIEKYQQGLLYGEERLQVEGWFDQLGADIPNDEWTEADKQKLKRKILRKIKGGENTFPRGFNSVYCLVMSLVHVIHLSVNSNTRLNAI